MQYPAGASPQSHMPARDPRPEIRPPQPLAGSGSGSGSNTGTVTHRPVDVLDFGTAMPGAHPEVRHVSMPTTALGLHSEPTGLQVNGHRTNVHPSDDHPQSLVPVADRGSPRGQMKPFFPTSDPATLSWWKKAIGALQHRAHCLLDNATTLRMVGLRSSQCGRRIAQESTQLQDGIHHLMHSLQQTQGILASTRMLMDAQQAAAMTAARESSPVASVHPPLSPAHHAEPSREPLQQAHEQIEHLYQRTGQQLLNAQAVLDHLRNLERDANENRCLGEQTTVTADSLYHLSRQLHEKTQLFGNNTHLQPTAP